MAGISDITVQIRVEPIRIDPKTLGWRQRLLYNLSKKPTAGFGLYRPTTHALRRALSDKARSRQHRCQMYAWLLQRRHDSKSRRRRG